MKPSTVRKAAYGYVETSPAMTSSSRSSNGGNGTTPVPLNPLDTLRLRKLFTSNLVLRESTDMIKEDLFSQPFEVYMGVDKSNELRPDVRNAVIGDLWLPCLNDIHDWLFQFGLAPYYIRKRKLSAKQKSFLDFGDKNENENDVDPDGGNAREPIDVWKSENRLVVLTFESGFVSTYVDLEENQKFLWTWYPNAVPASFDASNGYADYRVKFVVKHAPTKTGEYTCPLKTALKDYVEINTKKQMGLLTMKHRLNPLLLMERPDPNKNASKSILDETNVNYSNLFNMDMTESIEHVRISSGGGYGTLNEEGKIRMPYGKSFSIDATGLNGMEDAGLTYYDHMRGGVTGSGRFTNYSQLLNMLHKNYGTLPKSFSGSGRGGYDSNDFGGLESSLVTELIGKTAINESDPELYNPMSGISYRSKALREGEKVIEIEKDHLDAFIDKTPILEREKYFNANLGRLAGYPVEMLLLDGGKRTSSLPSAKSSGGFGSSGSVRFDDSSPSDDRHRLSVVKKLRSYKAYYEQLIAKLFAECYADSITASKMKLLQELEKKDWYVLEKVYHFSVHLPVNFPSVSSGKILSFCKVGAATETEAVRIMRLEAGLSLDVMDDPEFMRNAKKKIKTICEADLSKNEGDKKSKFDVEEKKNRKRSRSEKETSEKNEKKLSKKRKA